MPERYLFIRPDTYGDMVLFEPVLRLLRRYQPGCEIVMLVRKGYPDIAPMLSDDIRWLTVDINPYKMGPAECSDELKQLKLALDAVAPDIIVAPLINKTWLEIVAASWYPEARKIALGGVALDAGTADSLKKYLQMDTATIFTESIDISANMTEWENNLLLSSGLCHQSIASCIPQLTLVDTAEKQAEIILGERALRSKSWVACCPAGVSNVSIKKWPAEKYGQVIAWLKKEKNLEVCLLGHSNERHILEAVQEQSGKHGYRPLMWLGNDGDMPLLCSLLDKCEFYFGNDTGAMHMAGALNRPVVAIFGGGTWPRFKPAAIRSLAFVQKLPCFGCNWMCHFSTAPCIGSIPVERITPVLSEWLDSGLIPERKEIDIQGFSDDAVEIIRQAAINSREACIELSDLRLQVAVLTERLLESEADRSKRLEMINRIQKRLEEVEQERQSQIAVLTERLQESEADRSKRLEVINRTQERLEEVEQERQSQIAELTAMHQALENTLIVRMARRMRLIDVRCPDDNPK